MYCDKYVYEFIVIMSSLIPGGEEQVGGREEGGREGGVVRVVGWLGEWSFGEGGTSDLVEGSADIGDEEVGGTEVGYFIGYFG